MNNNCPQRISESTRQALLRLIRLAILVVGAFGFGSMITLRVHGQITDRLARVEEHQKDTSIEVAAMKTQLDHVQGQLNTAEGFGAGISAALVGLVALLEILKKEKNS